MTETTSPAVRLRREAWDAWVARQQLGSRALQAAHVGISEPTLFRALNGTPVGEQFIAGCMALYDGKFEDLFEVTEASS